jgi:glycosyltransferase involved in cell wall biosynthesis
VKIAILIDGIARGGAERQALNAVESLARLGHDATLFHYNDPAAYEPIAAHPAIAQGRVRHLERRGSISFVWRLARLLRRERFDVVHGFKSLPSIYTGLAGRLARVPVVVGGSRSGEYEWSGLMARLQRLTRGTVQAWIVNSEAVAESLCRHVGVPRERCHVVPNGIDCGAFRSPLGSGEARLRLGLPADAPTVICLAAFRPEKNHRLLIDAAARFLERVPSARLLLAGDGPERGGLERQVAMMNIAPRVTFLGNRADVADLLAATSVSVLSSDFEGISNAAIEAMCAGVPVVTTDYPGASALVSDGRSGYVVPRGDAAALADRLARILLDPAERDRMGREGREVAAVRFGIETMARNLLAVYTACGAGR